MRIDQFFLAVLIANLVGFGGLSSIPILRDQLMVAGLPADTLLLHSIAVGQISPGPNGLYVIATGYFVAGLWGVVAALIGIIIPPVLVLVLVRVRTRLLHLKRFRAVLHSLSLAVGALLASSSATLVQHAATDLSGGVMVVAGVVALLRGIPSLYGIAVAVIIGIFIP